MGALAIFAPARRLLRYALDFMHRKPLSDATRLRLCVSYGAAGFFSKSDWNAS